MIWNVQNTGSLILADHASNSKTKLYQVIRKIPHALKEKKKDVLCSWCPHYTYAMSRQQSY